MDITPSNLRVLRTSFINDFQGAYDKTDLYWQMIASLVPSSSAQNDYGWMTQLPSMKEWIGPRTVENLKTSSYVLKNKRFELTFGVDRDDIEDDNLGVYSMKSQAHGEAAAKHPDELVETLLKDGEALEAFDGQFFFDTDHPVDPFDAAKGVYSNFDAAATALDKANFTAVRARMMGLKGEGGRSLRVRPNLLVVPPLLETTALEIVRADLTNGATLAGGTNVHKGMADILVIDELAGEDTTWYLLDTSKMIKPFIYQLRRPLAITAKDRPDDVVVLEENELRFYADIRDNAGFSLPFLASKAVG